MARKPLRESTDAISHAMGSHVSVEEIGLGVTYHEKHTRLGTYRNPRWP